MWLLSKVLFKQCSTFQQTWNFFFAITLLQEPMLLTSFLALLQARGSWTTFVISLHTSRHSAWSPSTLSSTASRQRHMPIPSTECLQGKFVAKNAWVKVQMIYFANLHCRLKLGMLGRIPPSSRNIFSHRGSSSLANCSALTCQCSWNFF